MDEYTLCMWNIAVAVNEVLCGCVFYGEISAMYEREKELMLLSSAYIIIIIIIWIIIIIIVIFCVLCICACEEKESWIQLLEAS